MDIDYDSPEMQQLLRTPSPEKYVPPPSQSQSAPVDIRALLGDGGHDAVMEEGHGFEHDCGAMEGLDEDMGDDTRMEDVTKGTDTEAHDERPDSEINYRPTPRRTKRPTTDSNTARPLHPHDNLDASEDFHPLNQTNDPLSAFRSPALPMPQPTATPRAPRLGDMPPLTATHRGRKSRWDTAVPRKVSPPLKVKNLGVDEKGHTIIQVVKDESESALLTEQLLALQGEYLSRAGLCSCGRCKWEHECC